MNITRPRSSNEDAQFAVELQQALKAHGSELIILPIPNKPLIAASEAYYDAMDMRARYLSERSGLRRRGLIVIDVLTLALNEYIDPTTGLRFYGKADSHWTTYGAKLTASKIGELIRSSPKYATLPKVKYNITTVPTARVGNLALAVNHSCEKNFGSAPELSYTFVKQDQSSDLLSTDSIPIALAGTSYSKESYLPFANF